MRRLLLVALVGLLALAPPALSLTVNDVARDVRCPTCNTPLDVSNAPVAQRMKAFIGERIDRGWDEPRIVDALVAEFGREVLAVPPKSGFDLVAWLVPLGGVFGGLVLIGVLTRAWSRRAREPVAEGPPPLGPEEEARLERELRRRGGP